MKTALITGISGQDGPCLAKLLIEKDYKVIGTVRNYRCSNEFKYKYLGIDKMIIIEELDLLYMPNILRLFEKYKPNEVYNLDAKVPLVYHLSSPYK